PRALLDSFLAPNNSLSRCNAPPSDGRMHTTVPLLDLQAQEKRREEELEEARAIQSVMMPEESLHAGPVIISHEFQPMAAVGGDVLDYFEFSNGNIALYLDGVRCNGLSSDVYGAATAVPDR